MVVLGLAQSVGQVLDNLRNWLVGILAGLATLFLTLGGVRYVMAGGDPGEVERAKTAFRSAGIGYALAAAGPAGRDGPQADRRGLTHDHHHTPRTD